MAKRVKASGEMTDVAIVGTGFAGSLFAIKVAELGLKVRAFDALPEYPDHFRADKLETDQYEGLERLGMERLVEPRSSPFIEQVTVFKGRRRRIVPCEKHRGMDYQATTNRFRNQVKASMPLCVGKVGAVLDAADGCEIRLEDGSAVWASLAVIATGGSQLCRKSLGLSAPTSDALLSTTFGFFVEPTAVGFPTHAFNAIPERFIEGLHYVTFFPVGKRIKVNLFTCWHPSSEAVKLLRQDPVGELNRHFPMLQSQVGAFRLASPCQVFTTRYYRQDTRHLRSTVLIGDEYQSVSPATGMGISKCVTDARVLVDVLSALQNDKRTKIDLASFYNHPDKWRVDEDARTSWEWSNEVATSRSLSTRVKKTKIALKSMVFGQN